MSEMRRNQSDVIKTFILNFLSFYLIGVLLVSCTYSVTIAQTQGEASDVVDETSSNAPKTSVIPTFSIPSKNI